MDHGIALSIGLVGLLLLIAAVVAIVAHRLRLPYTFGLTLAGLSLAFSPLRNEFQLSRELILLAFLPPLIFEAAFAIKWDGLRQNLVPVGFLATFGVMVSACLVGIGSHFWIGWPVAGSILFAVLISPTDPVSIIAIFKEAGITGRLKILIEAESLVNDGAAAVLFSVALGALTTAGMSAGQVVGDLLLVIAGAVVTGIVVGGLALFLMSRSRDHLVDMTLTTVAAYGSFLVAERFGMSGILATLTAGILIGNLQRFGDMSDDSRALIDGFWEYAAFLANSLIFLLLGMTMAKQSLLADWQTLIIAVMLVVAGRAVAVYGCSLAFVRSKHRIPVPFQHVLFWGGLRGALSLALAFSLPASLPGRETIERSVFAAVAFSILVQGLTARSLLKRLGLAPS